MTKAELEEFKWTVDEYIKLGMSGDPRWHKQLENASARVHLNRLEALEIQMREQVERIYRGRETATREYLANLYEDNYYHNIFDIEQGVGIGLSFTRLDQKRLDLVTQKPWTTDNKTFSDRIWTSKQALINSLNRNLTQMIARGEAPDRTIAAIAKEFEKDKNTVGRLVMTESAAFSAKARADAYSELGVERFKIVATLDAKTSEICRDMDGKHFAEKDREIGVTCPPFHPWCRSTDVPYFDDEFTVGSLRVARDPNTGENYEVPANMTYEEWRKTHIVRSKGITVSGTSSAAPATLIGLPSEGPKSNIELKDSSVPKDYRSTVMRKFNSGSDDAKELYKKYVPDDSLIDATYTGISYYSDVDRKIRLDIGDDAVNLRGKGVTYFHEHGHYIDHAAGWVSRSSDFTRALREDLDDTIIAYTRIGMTRSQVETQISRDIQGHMNSSVSDIFEGLTLSRIVGDYGHGNSYWAYQWRVEAEAFAHFYEAQFSKKRYNNIKKYFPKGLAEFEKIIKGLI